MELALNIAQPCPIAIGRLEGAAGDARGLDALTDDTESLLLVSGDALAPHLNTKFRNQMDPRKIHT